MTSTQCAYADKLKECKKCHVRRPVDGFATERRMTSGRSTTCRECDNKAKRQRREMRHKAHQLNKHPNSVVKLELELPWVLIEDLRLILSQLQGGTLQEYFYRTAQTSVDSYRKGKM